MNLALPPWVAWLVLVGIAVTIGSASLGWAWRRSLQASLLFLGLAIMQDQNRFQAWIYQFLMIGLVIAFLPRAMAWRLARCYVVGLYAYSGLSKLDVSFCRELGQTFLSAGLGPLGISVERWPLWICLVLPGFEIVVAALLAFPRTRRLGLVGAVVQHSALIFILGPWNLGHSTIVLAWNLALIAQDLVLFGRSVRSIHPEVFTRPGRVVLGVFWLAMALPLGERWGFCDAWPAHALYASHAERSEVFLHEDDLDRFPESIRRRLEPGGIRSWRRLDVTAWSRDLRGTPPYPSGRVGNAVAESIEASFGGVQPVRLVQWGRASAWLGTRERDESLGLRAIRRRGDRFWINAHPRL